MKTRTKQIVSASIAIGAISTVVGGSVWLANATTPEPAPKQTYSRIEPAPETTQRQVTPTPTPTAEVTEVEVEPQAPVEQAPPAAPEPQQPAAPVQPEPQQPVAPQPEPQPQPEPEPAPVAVLCPAGSTSIGSDGFNDTACLPDICFSLTLPDPTHPECDTPFRP